MSNDFDQRGQNVQGDQYNIAGNLHLTRLDPADLRNQRNHAVLRQAVRRFWIDGVLKGSLYNEVRIHLGLESRSEAVDNQPWDLVLQQPGKPDQSIPSGTPIIDVFEQMNQRLLILGEPGSGKTTLLLELADALLNRSELQPLQQTPVVFNLSSWSPRYRSLTNWILDEFRTKYEIPTNIATAWLDKQELVILLDGLDEAIESTREVCVAKINQFRHQYMMPMVVCSRVDEYLNLSQRLKLEGAVSIGQLTSTQIDDYLSKLGPKLEGTRKEIHNHPNLFELAKSPLILGIIALSYQDVQSYELELSDATQTHQEKLFDTYLQKMFVHRKRQHLYSPTNTLHWLRWLAQSYQHTGLSIFLIDQIQPELLKSKRFRFNYLTLLIPFYGIIYGLIAGPVVMIISYQLLDLSLDRGIGFYKQVSNGLELGFLFGMLVTIIEFVSGRFRSIKVNAYTETILEKITSNFYVAVYWGGSVGILNWFYGGTQGLIMFSAFAGLGGWIAGAIRTVTFTRISTWTPRRILRNLWGGIISSVAFVLMYMLLSQIFFGSIGKGFGLGFWIFMSTFFGLIFESVSSSAEPSLQSDHKQTNLINSQAISSLIVGTLTGFGAGLQFGLGGYWSGLMGDTEDAIGGAIILGSLGLLYGVLAGGADKVLKHYFVRLILLLQNRTPFRYRRFLNFAVNLIFLRTVGNGYIFAHRSIMEHIAKLTDNDIKRISSEVHKWRKMN